MKNKFDEDELFDKAFDKAARDAFDDFEMPFDPSHWKRLEADLDRRRHKRIPAFWLFKSLEFVVVTAVFSYLVYGALPNTKVLDNSDLADNSQQNTLANTTNNSANNTNNSHTNNTTQVGQNEAEANSQYLANTYTLNSNTNGSKTIINANKPLIKTSKTANNISNFGLNTPTFTINKAQAFTAAVSHKGSHQNTANNSTNNSNSNSEKANATNTSNSENANIDAENAKADQVWPYPNLTTISIDEAAKIKQADPEPNFGLKKAKPIQPYVRQVKVAVLAGVDAHSRTDYGKGTSGYTFGLVAEGEFNARFALQAGLAFSSRNYEQERTIIIDSSQNGQENLTHEVKELRTTHANLLQLPLLLQITAYRNQKWRIYTQIGLSFYLNFSQTYKGSQQTTLAQSNGSVRFTTNIDRNQYEGALFQTRQLKNNVFVNAQIGLGLERQLSDSWSLFVQPNFQYSLTKMNSYGNRNHVLSLHVGAKTTF
jgi:hypothetical protein